VAGNSPGSGKKARSQRAANDLRTGSRAPSEFVRSLEAEIGA